MPLVTLHLKLPSQYWHAQRVRSGEDMEHTHTHFFKRRERDRDIQRETLDTKEKRKKRNRASSSSAHSPPQIAWTSQTIFSPPSLSLYHPSPPFRRSKRQLAPIGAWLLLATRLQLIAFDSPLCSSSLQVIPSHLRYSEKTTTDSI